MPIHHHVTVTANGSRNKTAKALCAECSTVGSWPLHFARAILPCARDPIKCLREKGHRCYQLDGKKKTEGLCAYLTDLSPQELQILPTLLSLFILEGAELYALQTARLCPPTPPLLRDLLVLAHSLRRPQKTTLEATQNPWTGSPLRGDS